MFVLSITPGQIASSVWTQATRTLTALAGQPATDVWASATRTITADPSPFTIVTARGSLAASTILDLRPAANKFREVNWCASIVNGSLQAGLYDGANFDLTGQNPGIVYGFGMGSATRGFSFDNTNGASAQAYSYGGWDRG